MKKIGKIAFLFIILTSTSTLANAALFSPKGLSYSCGAPIWTVSIKTPNGEPLLLDRVETFIGKSISNPCSDLTTIETLNNFKVNPGTIGLSSRYFAALLLGNTQVTCMKIDMATNNKTYSTGNLKITWDDSREKYTKVEPSETYIDFTS